MKSYLAIVFLVFLSSISAYSADLKPCEADIKKSCPSAGTPESTIQCLSKVEKLAPLCKTKLPALTKEVIPCAQDIPKYCPEGEGVNTYKNYFCLMKFTSKLSKDCKARVELVKKKLAARGNEGHKLFLKKCAAEAKSLCPGVDIDKDFSCLVKAWKDGKVVGECNTLMDEFDMQRQRRR